MGRIPLAGRHKRLLVKLLGKDLYKRWPKLRTWFLGHLFYRRICYGSMIKQWVCPLSHWTQIFVSTMELTFSYLHSGNTLRKSMDLWSHTHTHTHTHIYQYFLIKRRFDNLKIWWFFVAARAKGLVAESSVLCYWWYLEFGLVFW